jgi:Txe/YoeB family toxin of Txe-Axe toxin-antitoxin module
LLELSFSKKAKSDFQYLKEAALDEKTKGLLRIIEENPFQMPPPFGSAYWK